MRIKILIMVVAIVGLMLATAYGADISGTWKGEYPGRDGQVMEITSTFMVDGSELTGSMSSSGPTGGETPISEGKIDGDNISFAVKIDSNGNEMKITFNGKIAGEELKLTMGFEGGMGGGPGGGGGMGDLPELVLQKVN